jgi:hypothetical protein
LGAISWPPADAQRNSFCIPWATRPQWTFWWILYRSLEEIWERRGVKISAIKMAKHFFMGFRCFTINKIGQQEIGVQKKKHRFQMVSAAIMVCWISNIGASSQT